MWHTEHFHQYADDINIYTSLSSCSADLKQLTLCTSILQHWLWHNWLLLNPDKSVAALFGTRQCLARPAWPTRVAVVGSDIKKCITACQTPIFKGYRECRMLLHELFAKLQNANITQPTFWRISIGYLCTAELTTRMKIAVLCYKAVKLQQPSYLTCLFGCSEVIYARPTFNTVFIDKHCFSSVLTLRPTVWNSLPSFVRTADSFTSFRSQLKTIHYVRETFCSRSVRAWYPYRVFRAL